jgi:hypothetical protein
MALCGIPSISISRFVDSTAFNEPHQSVILRRVGNYYASDSIASSIVPSSGAIIGM